MGSLLFDFLLDSPLFETREEEVFDGMADADLLRHLRDYREFVLGNIDALHREVQGSGSNFRVLAPHDEIGIDLLRHLSLYVQQFLLKDPLFPLTVEPGEFDRAQDKLFNLNPEAVNRHRLARVIKYLRLLQPFVAANYVKILPVSYLRERSGGIPIYFDPDNFSKALPEETMRYIHDHALVESVVKVENEGWRTDRALYPCRSIYVSFEGHHFSGGMFFRLANQEVLGVSEREGREVVQFAMTYPEEPPTLDRFRVWVEHAIIERLSTIIMS